MKTKTAEMTNNAADRLDMISSRKRLGPSRRLSAQRNPLVRPAAERVAGPPHRQTQRHKTAGDDGSEQKPDHRRQADRHYEDAADSEHQSADIAGDFRGRKVDFRRCLLLAFRRRRKLARM